MSITLTVNAAEIQTDAAPDTPLLWVLRDELGLTGTKFGCGIAACGGLHRACRGPSRAVVPSGGGRSVGSGHDH